MSRGEPIFDRNHKFAGSTPGAVKVPEIISVPPSPIKTNTFPSKGTNRLPYLKYLLQDTDAIDRYSLKTSGDKAEFRPSPKDGEYFAVEDIKKLLKKSFNKKVYLPFLNGLSSLPHYLSKKSKYDVGPERIYLDTKLPTWLLDKDLYKLLDSLTAEKLPPVEPPPAVAKNKYSWNAKNKYSWNAKNKYDWSIDFMKPHIEFVLNKENEVHKYGPHACGMCGTGFAIDMEEGEYLSLGEIRMAFNSNYDEDMYLPFLEKIKTLPRFDCHGDPDYYDYWEGDDEDISEYTGEPIIESIASDNTTSGYVLFKDVITAVAEMKGA
jgi:hypothetical protein